MDSCHQTKGVNLNYKNSPLTIRGTVNIITQKIGGGTMASEDKKKLDREKRG